MKIAIIADPINNQNAGVHVYTKQVVTQLIQGRDNYEIVIVCEERIPELDCRQIVIPNTRLPIGFASLRLFLLVPLALIWENVDVVIEPAHFGPWNLPGRILRTTVIHDMTPLIFPEHHRWHSQMLQRIFLKRILRKTDLIITNSDNTSNDVIRIFPEVEEKIQRIYLGVDPIYSHTEERHLIDDLPFDTSMGFFHFVGTLEPRKGVVLMIRAYNIFRRHNTSSVPLIICGAKGWKTEDIFKEHEKSPYQENIHFLGFVEQQLIIQLHSHSLSMIYPSKYEGFGLPVAEALRCKGKVITCNNSSLTEVGGNFAYYFDYGDSDQLAQKMLEAHSSNSSSRDKEAQSKWVDQFSWNKYSQVLVKKLRERIPFQH